MFGELIIMIVYLPILTLEGVEGKLFRPMALTVIFALVGSLVLSLTLMPVLASLLLPRRMEEKEPWLVRAGPLAVCPVLRLRMRHGVAVLGLGRGCARPGGAAGASNSGARVRAAAVRRRLGHRHPALGRNRPRRIAALQHADGESCCWQSSPTRSSTSGAAAARPRWPPIRWGRKRPICSSRSSRASSGQ